MAGQLARVVRAYAGWGERWDRARSTDRDAGTPGQRLTAPGAEARGERASAVAGGAAPGPLRAFAESFLSFLKKPKVALVIGFIVLFKAGDALLFNMSVPFLKHLGLDTDMRGLLSAPSLIASIAGTTIGGVWIRRATLAKTLFPIAVMQTFAIPLYTALAILRPSFRVIAVSVS